MIEKQLVRCIQCNAVALFSSVDRSPEYHKEHGKWVAVEHDDRALFLQRHLNHPHEVLQVLEGSFMSYQDYWEPVKTSYFEATNGREHFVVKKSRKSILDPYRYELIAGRLRLIPGRLTVDKKAIQGELERALSPSLVSSQKIKIFVESLGRTVSRIRPQELKRIAFERKTPVLWSYSLDKRIMETAFRACSNRLARRERDSLACFLRESLDDDLFVATARVQFRIERERPKIAEPERESLISEPSPP
ncbi:MAG: hypothetical protein JRH07_01685 [Deltaproteobacteria bacterium]|nr:hypothetical protein [Deltaproteobacteria bacterium]MBW2120543.1 hypothetical protein [Deltaproteobacteria bacterium]